MKKNVYRSGRSREYLAKKRLEKLGYSVMRSAGSHGIYDLIAWNESHIKFIQVKSGGYRLSKEEKEKFLNNEIPPNGAKQLWIYFPNKQPIILSENEIRYENT